MILPCLFIAETAEKGRGVFTAEPLAAGTLIEVAPVIVMSQADRLLIDKTLLYNYIFEWGADKDRCCLALGYVSIYNHDYTANCTYEMDNDHDTIAIRTVTAVEAGGELTINYNGEADDRTRVWFDVAG